MKLLKEMLSVFLSVLTILGIMSTATSVFAAEYTENKARKEYFDSALSGYLKNIIDTDDAVKIVEKENLLEAKEAAEQKKSARSYSAKAPFRINENDKAETVADDATTNIDHTKLTLDLGDGENTVYLFSEPVSFIDENGELVYKDTNIKTVTDESLISQGYIYENGDNNYKVYFSEDSSKGVLLVTENGDEIKLAPYGEKSNGEKSQVETDRIKTDAFIYTNAYGADTFLRFLPQLNGIKDEIVLNKYMGKSSFAFTLNVGENIAAINSRGEVEIINGSKEIIQTFAAPFAYDAVGSECDTDEHYTDCTYSLEKVSEGQYTLSVNVPERFLTSENTVYPVTVDPATGNVMVTNDAGVYSANADNTYGTQTTACVGKTSSSEYGKGRAMFFFRVPTDIKSYAKISSAKLWLREITARTATMYVRPYLNKEAWSNTVTWNTQPAHYSTFSYPGKTGLTLARRNINSKSTDDESVPYWYAFDITNAVRAWTTGTKNKGLKFIAECEAADGDYLWRGFATKEYATSTFHPYAVISYKNDTTAPTISSVSGNPTDWTKSNVTLKVTATDDVYGASGIASYSFDNGSTWQTSNSKAFSSNQTVSIKVKDLAGNISAVKTVKITKIDKTAPAATITLSPTTPTNGNVTATIKLTDNAELKSYKIGSDAAVSISGTSKTVTKTYSADATVSVTVTDAAGNSKTVSKSFTNIDKIKPVIQRVLKDPTGWTNGDVTLTVIATDEESGIAAYSFDDGATWQTTNSKTFEKNKQAVKIRVKDKAGNPSEPTIVDISNIDKSNPEVSASCTATSASVRINVTASDEISGLHETAYSYNNGAWTSQSYFDVQNQDAVSIRVRDLAGNIETLSYTPDPLCPTEVVVNPSSGWTNGDVTITVNGTGLSKYKYGSNNWVTSNTYLVSQNGSVSISVEDANKKQKALNDVTISNIDKDLPVISNVTVSESTWTNNPVTVTVNASDALSGIASYSFDGGASWQVSNSKTFSETNDSIVVKVKDNAGNETTYSEIVKISSIDATAPETPVIYAENGTVYLSNQNFDFDEATDSPEHLEYKIGDGGTWITYEEPLTLVNTYDVTVYARSVDEAGNVSGTSSAVVKSTIGEYTASYTDIAYGEGVFPVPFGRTYSSTNGWFFSFNAKIREITGGYIFTDFSGSEHYFLKNNENKYVSVDGDELELNADNYAYKVPYGDLICYFGADGKPAFVKDSYISATYTWTASNLYIEDQAGNSTIVRITNQKPANITISRHDDATGENHTKYVSYQWDGDNLIKFTDAANNAHSYAYTNGLLTQNETETIDYSAQGRVKRITQLNGAFVKYTYNDNAASANQKAPENIGAVTVADSKGVTDIWYYSDGIVIANSLDNYSDNATYDPNNISNALTEDNITNVAYALKYVGGESEDSAEDDAADASTKTPLYNRNSDGSYTFYKYDSSDRVIEFLEVAKGKLAVTTDTTYAQAEAVAKSKTTIAYVADSDRIAESVTLKRNSENAFVNAQKEEYTYYENEEMQTSKSYTWADNNWRIASEEQYDQSGKTALTDKYDYDTEETQITRTTYTYDDKDRQTEELVRVKSGESSFVNQTIISTSYNGQGDITVNTAGQWLNNAWYQISCEEFFYNAYGNNTKKIETVCKNTLNSETALVETTQTQTITDYVYDVWNQPVGTTVKTGNETEIVTGVQYDILGRTTSVTEDGKTTAYTYDNMGNVLTITNEDGTTIYVYDASGKLVSRTDPDGKQASYTYDSYGNATGHQFNGYSFTYNTFGSILTAKTGEQVIASYTYSASTKQEVLNAGFGNGQNVNYIYDEDGRITETKFGEQTKYGYAYFDQKDVDGNVTKEWTELTDYVNNLKKVFEENKTIVNDLNGNLVYSVESVSKNEENADSFDGRITTIGNDIYTLVTEENKDIFKNNGAVAFEKSYHYSDTDELESTQIGFVQTSYGYNTEKLISLLTNTLNNVTKSYSYTYDKNGNIKSEIVVTSSQGEQGETVETTKTTHYTYDSKKQLVASENGSVRYTYSYDSRGNILSKKEYTVTLDGNNEKVYTETESNSYSYDETWKDKLTSYNGQTITYDASGNPLNYMGHNLSWTMGRQLASFDGITYTYNENGIRTSKTVDNVTTTYYLDGTNIIEQIAGNTVLHFYYDSNDEVIGFEYNSDNYYYVKNATGDVVGIADSDGNIVASYTYDPWGKVLSVTGDETIGNLNPFRYRSYYYDSDIQMYYLQSRYYDPEVGRFINCDDVNYIGITESGISYNPFAYCENDPVDNTDSVGYGPWVRHLSLWDYRRIHNKVADLAAWSICNWGARREKYVKGPKGKGFLDIYNNYDNTYYEVKSRGAAYLGSTVRQMQKYDVAKPLLSKRGNVKRGTQYIWGTFYYGAWYVDYRLVSPGLIAYSCTWCQNRMEKAYGIALVAVVVISIATIATGGATAPAYGLLVFV